MTKTDFRRCVSLTMNRPKGFFSAKTFRFCVGLLLAALIPAASFLVGPQVADLLVAEVVDGHAAVLLCAM